jgi:hypothetical protein
MAKVIRFSEGRQRDTRPTRPGLPPAPRPNGGVWAVITCQVVSDPAEALPTWAVVFRNGIAPELTTAELTALRVALDLDDGRLTQGATTTPPPMDCAKHMRCEGACAIGYAGWVGDDLPTVGDVEEFFARVCWDADQRLGEAGGVRHFINWFDETPRDEVRRLLLAEIDRVLAERAAGGPRA